MTAAPIDIPLDDRGAPDLQLLVRKLGEAAAKARGEAYAPAHNPAHAGYPRITPAIWQAFDAAMAEYQRACRAGLASAAPSNAGTRRRPPSAEFTRQRLPNHRGHELKHDRIRVPAVVAPRLCLSDSMIERLAVLLEARPQGLAFVADELARLFLNMKRYSNGHDNEFWLEAWNGKNFIVERQGRPPVVLDYLLVGVTGGFLPTSARLSRRRRWHVCAVLLCVAGRTGTHAAFNEVSD
jgi:hypothetical protein